MFPELFLVRSADLHMHTLASDGTDTIEERLEQAENSGLSAIAITDHDAINSGLNERASVTENGVELIAGAEIKCEIEGYGIEILGYFLDPSSSELHNLFERLENFRVTRMQEMIENVNETLNANIDYNDVALHAEGPVGRPHLARAMSEKEIVNSPGQAFDKYIGDNDSCYVETEKIDAEEVIEIIHQNGGATSLAHPGRDLERAEADEIVQILGENGLDAIEVPYTYNHKRQEDYEINFGSMRAYDLAREHNLLITGGSDCHGMRSDKHNIGKIKLDYEHLEKLREKSEEYRF